jgi:hypothetical protein
MKRLELLRLLEELERQVSYGMELLARLRKLLARLDPNEVDIDAVKIMLVELENQLDINLQERDKVRVELARLTSVN